MPNSDSELHTHENIGSQICLCEGEEELLMLRDIVTVMLRDIVEKIIWVRLSSTSDLAVTLSVRVTFSRVSFFFFLLGYRWLILLSWRTSSKICASIDTLTCLRSCCSWKTVNFLFRFPTSCSKRYLHFLAPGITLRNNRLGTSQSGVQSPHVFGQREMNSGRFRRK